VAIGRHEALRTIEEGWTDLDALFGRLSDRAFAKPASIGGGEWSAQDLLGHIATWEAIALAALGDWREGKRPWIEDVFAADGGIDELNAKTVTEKRDLSLEAIRSDSERIHWRLAEELIRLSDGEWTARAPYETERRQRLGELLGSIMGAPKRPFGHAFAHVPDLEAYVTSLR